MAQSWNFKILKYLQKNKSFDISILHCILVLQNTDINLKKLVY